MNETKLMHDTRAAVAALIMGDASLLLRHLHLLEQIRMIALFDAEDRVTRIIVQGFNVRGIGAEPIFGDNKLQMRVILAQLRHKAFGGIALTIIFLGGILLDDRFEHYRYDFTL